MEPFYHEIRDMRESRNADNQTSRLIKDRLKWSQERFWQVHEEGVAIEPWKLEQKVMDHGRKYRHGSRAALMIESRLG